MEPPGDKIRLLKFIKENLTFTGEDAPGVQAHGSHPWGVAEFERSLIRESSVKG
jgi:hypothetical protein